LQKGMNKTIQQKISSFQGYPAHASTYKLSDLQARPIEGKFYNCKLIKVTVSPKPSFI